MNRRGQTLIATLLLACSALADAEPPALGRLFLEPQQRTRLDQQRRQNPGFQPNAEQGSLTINGEVRSSNGRRTRWINGEANWGGTVAAPNVPVGDTLNRATGERESLLGEGRINIHRPRP